MIYWITVKKNLIKRGKKCNIYIIVKISYYDLLGNSKKNLMEKGKKKLNAILECHVAGPHAFSHEVSALLHWSMIENLSA